MGFRCPICQADFGRDKKRWTDHIRTAHQGSGIEVVNELDKATKNPNFVGLRRQDQEASHE